VVTRLTDNNVGDATPVWSPDGKKIVFHRRVVGHLQLFVVDVATKKATQLTESSLESFNALPSWSPRLSPVRR
jgi:Tol biopolymer transport system component